MTDLDSETNGREKAGRSSSDDDDHSSNAESEKLPRPRPQKQPIPKRKVCVLHFPLNPKGFILNAIFFFLTCSQSLHYGLAIIPGVGPHSIAAQIPILCSWPNTPQCNFVILGAVNHCRDMIAPRGVLYA